MGIPGEDLKGVYTASEYLAKYNLMSPEELAEALPSLRGKRVAVIGGGNTAIDAVPSSRACLISSARAGISSSLRR